VVLFLRMEVKASMTGARGWVVPSLAALAWLTAGTYLGGGIALVQLLLLLGGVMLPATALVADTLAIKNRPMFLIYDRFGFED
jgi:ABC-type proline/glycine betaine transport system permease subunit